MWLDCLWTEDNAEHIAEHGISQKEFEHVVCSPQSEELPDMVVRDQMRKDACEEATVSGELRRAVHRSDLSLAAIAEQVAITPRPVGNVRLERPLPADIQNGGWTIQNGCPIHRCCSMIF